MSRLTALLSAGRGVFTAVFQLIRVFCSVTLLVAYEFSDVSKEHNAIIFKGQGFKDELVLDSITLEVEVSTVLRKVCNHSLNDIASYPRRSQCPEIIRPNFCP